MSVQGMRAGKARAVQAIHSVTASTSTRCICAFSTSCRSSQHEQEPNTANTSYYDRLFAGLGGTIADSGPASSVLPSPRKDTVKPGMRMPPSEYRPPASASQNFSQHQSRLKQKLDNEWRNRQSPLPGGAGSAASSSNSHFLDMMRGLTQDPPKSLNHPKEAHQQERDSHEGQRTSTSAHTGVRWKTMLDKIERARRKPNRPLIETLSPQPNLPAPDIEADPYSFTEDAPAQEQQSQLRSRSAQSHLREHSYSTEERLSDQIFNSQAQYKQYGLQLREEVKDLRTALEGLRWMQDRIFSPNSEDSLVNKLREPSSASTQNQELQFLYSEILVDLTNLFREKAPTTAMLPFSLARSHSPISYLYGCTARLYAANIRNLWENFGDIQGCLVLIEEMQRNAVHLSPQINDYIMNMNLAVMADRTRAQKQADEEKARAAPFEQEKLAVPAEASPTSADVAAPAADADGTPHGPIPGSSAHARLAERLIEHKLFFSPAQSRALRDIERLADADRKRFLDARARLDFLQDAISARSRVGRYASPEEQAAAETEAAGLSDVDALVDSYGKAVTLNSHHGGRTHRKSASSQGNTAKPTGSPARQRDTRSTGASDSAARVGTLDIEEAEEVAAPVTDVLDAAVSELSEAPPRPKTQRKSNKPVKRRSSWISPRKSGPPLLDNQQADSLSEQRSTAAP